MVFLVSPNIVSQWHFFACMFFFHSVTIFSLFWNVFKFYYFTEDHSLLLGFEKCKYIVYNVHETYGGTSGVCGLR